VVDKKWIKRIRDLGGVVQAWKR